MVKIFVNKVEIVLPEKAVVVCRNWYAGYLVGRAINMANVYWKIDGEIEIDARQNDCCLERNAA